MNRPTRPSPARPLRLTLPLALLILPPLFGVFAGCSSSGGGAQTSQSERAGTDAPTPLRAPDGSPRPSSTRDRSADRVALLIDGEPVIWATLRPLLAEAAGGEVVDELALEHALRKELGARGVTVGDAQIEAARESWLALLEESGVSARAEAEIRRRRGLGEERFRRLLWRNAALRALVDPAEIEVSESEVGLARAIRSGRRYLVTGVIARDSSTALAIAQRARTGTDANTTPAAAMWSASRDRDLVPFRSVISPLDPQYPESVRRALPSLGVGRVSAAIAVDGGFAVVLVDGIVEPTGAMDDGSADDAALRRELAIRKTRVAMETLARSLVERTEVNAIDRSLSR